MRACSIPSTSFTVAHRPITSLTSSLRHFNKPRAAVLPSLQRFVQNEAAQAESEADGAEEAQLSDDSISEGFRAEAEEYENNFPSSASSEDPATPSSTFEAAGSKAYEASEAAESANASAPDHLEYGMRPSRTPRDIDSRTGDRFGVGPTIYIGNLNFDTTEVQIAEHFQKAGQITTVSIVRDARGFNRGLVPRVIGHLVDYVLTC